MTVSEAHATSERRPLLLAIEPAGLHKFTYTKLEPDTGEVVWRWPDARPLAERPVAALGQLLDMSV